MKNIYITWHYTTHGIAYFKHILSAFYKNGIEGDSFPIKSLNQEDLNDFFDSTDSKGFKFDEIIYLTAPQNTFDKLSSRRFNYKKDILKDEQVNLLGLNEVYDKIRSNDEICYKIEEELKFIEKNYSQKKQNFIETIWRDIQHYPIAEQIKWLNEKSNFQNIYPIPTLKPIVLDKIDDLRNEKLIAQELTQWLKKYLSKQKGEFQLFINVSLGSNETQVVWHVLSEANLLPAKTRFFKTYDDKTSTKGRFKLFSINEIEPNLISSISDEFRIFADTQSQKRVLVDKKMEVFLKTGFSILLIGERGIGKSQIAGKAKEKLEKLDNSITGQIIEVNCASFDDDSKAEAELFGYEKGAFTGANQKGKDGLLEEAKNGILFLDEIHHLSKYVQAKLMKALQTDEYNRLTIRKLGATKEIKVKDVRLIFATNKTTTELRECLLPDFYDRIVQHVISIPSLRETVEDRETDWENVWEQLKFRDQPKAPKEPKLMKWLKKLPLYGNYRDLQKIAMYYNAFNKFEKGILREKTAFEYAKNEFEKYHSPTKQDKSVGFSVSPEKTADEMIADFQFQLQEWATKKWSRKEAAKKLKITEKTLNNWKNKRKNNITNS